jgi:purine-binding chemotaxis protein CheW
MSYDLMSKPLSASALLLRAGERTCALNLSHVLEVMRPLPVEAVANTPDFVTGLSIIRGEPTPVVSLPLLLADKSEAPGRFVLVRAGQRKVALAVDTVLGVFDLGSTAMYPLPSLAGNAAASVMQALGTLDAQVLFVLNSANIVPDEVWRELAGRT